MKDPALSEFVALTTRYKTTIALATLVVAGAGVGIGSLGPKTITGVAVVHPASVAPNGAVENPEVSASRVQTFVESKVMTGSLDEGTTLEATVVRDQPPSAQPVDLLALRVTAPNPEAAERALKIAIDELRSGQDPLFEDEQARLTQNIQTYERDIERMSATPISKSSYESVYRAIVDLSQTARWLQPVRTHELQVLVGPDVDESTRTPRVIAFGAFGLVAGIGLGYFIAFVLAGLRAVRAAA